MHIISYIEPTVGFPSTQWFHKWFLLPVCFCLWAKVQTVPNHLSLLSPPPSVSPFPDWHSEVIATGLAPAVLYLDNQIFKCVSESLPPVINAKLLPGTFSYFRSLFSAAQCCRGRVCSWAHACHFWELTWGSPACVGEGASFILCPRAVPSKQTWQGKRMINLL